MAIEMEQSKQQTQKGGWMVIEMVISLGVLTILLGGFAITQGRSRRFNDFQLAQQRCITAAQAQLDSIAARGKSLDSGEVERLWPGMKTTIDESPGQGDWAGLTLIEVTAGRMSFDRTVQVKLARYIAGGRKP